MNFEVISCGSMLSHIQEAQEFDVHQFDPYFDSEVIYF